MLPVHQTRHFRDVSYVGYVCPTVVPEMHLPSVQSTAMALFACYGSGATVGHCQQSGQPPVLRRGITPNCRVLFLCCPLRGFGCKVFNY